MVPISIICGLTCSDCFKLWSLLDSKQGSNGWPWRGVGPIAAKLGWKAQTVKTHALHLADAGLIDLDPRPERGKGWSEIRFKVAHNPARGRAGKLRFTERWVAQVPVRWKRGSPADDFEALRHGAQGTSSRCPDPPKGHPDEVPLSRSALDVMEGSALDLAPERSCACGEPIVKIDAEFCSLCENF
jgi:hypothetical protein